MSSSWVCGDFAPTGGSFYCFGCIPCCTYYWLTWMVSPWNAWKSTLNDPYPPPHLDKKKHPGVRKCQYICGYGLLWGFWTAFMTPFTVIFGLCIDMCLLIAVPFALLIWFARHGSFEGCCKFIWLHQVNETRGISEVAICTPYSTTVNSLHEFWLYMFCWTVSKQGVVSSRDSLAPKKDTGSSPPAHEMTSTTTTSTGSTDSTLTSIAVSSD
ncbi:hypothetical protein Pelo_17048 [Pelomyxa schiedti]|nr:hypothetical protein Pelo_17048 [Pelomyxa schiedti]